MVIDDAVNTLALQYFSPKFVMQKREIPSKNRVGHIRAIFFSIPLIFFC